MNLSKETIDRYLAGQCTAEEAAAIATLLEQQPGLLDQYVGQEDWNAIDSSNTSLPVDIAAKNTAVVMKHIRRPGTVVKLVNRKWMVAAACFTAVTGGALYFLLHKSPVPEQQALAIVQAPKGSSKPLQDTLVLNEASNKKIVPLKDGSQVSLSPHASIRYMPAFNSATREIHLTGEAYFKVAKDKTRPFTVFSNGITTTALGTSFTIKAPQHDHRVSVMLYTGKVVVRRECDHNKADDIYLLPGNQLSIDTKTFASHLEKIEPPIIPAKEAIVVKPILLDFDRDPLDSVFSKLSQQYHQKIQFESASLSGLSFTGSVDTGKPLEQALRSIALLNNLTVTSISGGYNVGAGQ